MLIFYNVARLPKNVLIIHSKKFRIVVFYLHKWFFILQIITVKILLNPSVATGND